MGRALIAEISDAASQWSRHGLWSSSRAYQAGEYAANHLAEALQVAQNALAQSVYTMNLHASCEHPQANAEQQAFSKLDAIDSVWKLNTGGAVGSAETAAQW